jgi:WD40 repeat protein
MMNSFETTAGCHPSFPAWSPEGDRIVTGCVFTPAQGDHTPASVWDAESGTLLLALESDHGESMIAEWSPDGRHLAVGYELAVAKVWEVATGKVVTVYPGHSGWVQGLAWAPSGNRIASGDLDGNVKVWDAWTGEEVQAAKAPSTVYNIDWSPAGDQLIAAGAFNTPLVFQVWVTTEDLIAHANECCVFRELTAEERVQFGLPPR